MHLLRQSTSQLAIRSIFLSGHHHYGCALSSAGSSAIAIVTDNATPNTAIASLNVLSPTSIETLATTTASLSGNLNASEAVKTFRIPDPINTSPFSTRFQMNVLANIEFTSFT